MKTFKNTAFSFLLVVLTSCSVAINTLPEKTVANSSNSLNNIALNGKVFSAVWQQNAGEFRALCYQAYNLAQLRIDENLKNPSKKPLAIITDIDETFIDNSPYAVTEAEKGNIFDAKTLATWTSKGEAKAYPGSLNLFNYAASKKIEIFYISNRSESDRTGTLKNLKDLGFPNADDVHLMLKGTSSDKEDRRLEVLKNYDVIIYMGDNLADFSKTFNKKPQTERNELVDQNSNQFGKRFIILPNSGYGDWESALPGSNNNLTPAEKDKVFLKNLRGY